MRVRACRANSTEPVSEHMNDLMVIPTVASALENTVLINTIRFAQAPNCTFH